MIAERQRILLNSASNVAFYAIQVAVVLFVSPVLVHGLGDNRYGAWTLVNSVAAYLALADLGIGAAVLRYVAKFAGLRDGESINRVFSASLCMFACAGAGVLAITVSLVVLWQSPFDMTGDLARDMRWMIAMFGANLSILLPLGIYKTVLMGLGRYPVVNAVRITTLLLRNAGMVLVLHSGGGLREIAATLVATSLIDQAWCFLAAHHYLPSLRFSFRFVDRGTLRAIWGYSVFVFLSVIAGKVGSESSAFVISFFLPTATVTYFGIAFSLWVQAGDGLRAAIAVLTPTVSKWEAEDDHSAIARLLTTGTRYLLFLTAPIQMGLIFLGHPFISLWMGKKYADLCAPSLAILALSLTPALAMAMADRILEGVGKVAGLFWFQMVQSLLTVGLSLVLIVPLGIQGVAWATVVPLLVQSVAMISIACRASKVPLATYLARAWPLPAAAATALAGVWLLAGYCWGPISTWQAFIARGLGGMAIYAPAVLCLDSSLRRRVLHRVAKWMPAASLPVSQTNLPVRAEET
jgi:O-antigen/teichoic acid export membrane protein